MVESVYLDCNASAPLRPEARDCMVALLSAVGNPSSIHAPGRALKRHIEDARDAVAALVGAPPDAVIFTSGGTEANNTVLKNTQTPRIWASAGEHPSVLAATPDPELLPLTPTGSVDGSRLDTAPPDTLVSIMMANNETGVINPLADIVSRVHHRGGYVHSDAVQAVGRVPVAMGELGLDYLTVSAHKIGGPRGIGALVVREGAPFAPQLAGGNQQDGRRAGTEDVVAIAGFGAAAAAAHRDLGRWHRVAALRDEFEARLSQTMPEAVIFGRDEPRLPNTSCFALNGIPSEIQVMHLDLAGIAVSAGSACSSGIVAPSHVLRAMGVDAAVAACAIRVSLGLENSPDDLDRLYHQLMALRTTRHQSTTA